jgi:hypothetical protein
LPQGSHTPDEVFLILCRVFSFSGVFAWAPSDLDRLSFLTLHVLLLCIGPCMGLFTLSYLWYSSEFCFGILVGLFLFFP